MSILQDKVAIVTGASRGIGRAIAESFAKEGAKLILTAKQNLDALSSFSQAKAVRLDLSAKQSIDSLISEAIKNFGRIDILVNNAGIFKQTDFESISEDELDNFMDVDFKGPFLLTQKVFGQMKRQNQGRIINIVSGAAKLGSSKAIHYSAAKGALISLTRSLARLGGAYNINVNAIAPGFIKTDMINDLLLKKKESIEALIPLKRVGSPADLAGLAVFFGSDNSSYITGQVICVDGGHCMV